MSSLANSGISISKKALTDSRMPTYHRTVCFYHKATAGQTVINLNALTMPSELSNVTQINIEEISTIGLFYNRKNLQLVSGTRQELLQGMDYTVTNGTTITLAYPAEGGEIFIGRVLAVPYDSIDTLIERLEMKPTVVLAPATLNIDWSLGYVFTKNITVNSTFTFSNPVDGRVITVVLKNTSAATRTVAFPAGIWRDSGMELTIEAGKKNAYTFIRESNGEITCSFMAQLVAV